MDLDSHAALVELLDVGVTLHDADGGLVHANAAARALMAELAGLAEVVAAAIRERRPRHTALAGRSGAVAVAAAPQLDATGAVRRVVCTLREASQGRERERLLTATFRAMAEGVAVHGPDGAIRMVNPAAERILGISFDESTRRTAVDPRWRLIDAQGEPLRAQDIPSEITQRTGAPCVDVRIGVHRPDGSRAWLSVNTAPVLLDDEVRPAAVVATFQDITAVRETQQALERSRNEFKRVVDVVPGVIFEYVLADEGAERFTFVSARARELVGVEAERVLADAQALWDRVLPDDLPQVRRSLAASARALGPWEQRLRLVGGAEGPRWVHGRAVPERRAGATAWVGVLVDVTEEVRLAETLREAQRLDVLGDLAAGIAHNFNNLLMVTQPNLESALADAPEALRGRLGDAVRATQSAAGLVRRLMELARPERDVARRREQVDLAGVVREVTALMLQAFDRRIRLEVSTPAGAAWADGNRSDFDQALLNLLLNARDAVEGVAEPRIEVGLESARGEAVHRLHVRDNGSGMTEEVRRRIGQPFFTTKAPGRGTGLGLATTERLIRGWGGRLEVTTAPGAGTTFALVLPAVAPPVPAGAGERAAVPRLRGTALIVDDEPAVRRSLAVMLRRLGMTAEEATSGDEGLRALASAPGRYAVVLLDLSMPGRAGAGVLQRLRAQEQAPPIVVVSGDVLEDAPLAGAAAVLEKPVSLARLAGCLARLVPPGE